jgi:2-polyprenyl-3-methyl-5-hydroxy-6-metoxy-1,4-benzoquinol methylase
MHNGVKLAEKDNYSIIDCSHCGFIHAKAIDEKRLPDLYSSHFYEEEKPDYVKQNVYDAKWWEVTYTQRINQADDLSPKLTKKWLDIGTGPGNFLDAAASQAKRVIGVEPSVAASQHASSKGHEVINAYYSDEVANKLEKFDGIHCSEVLEHIPDPRKFLNNIKRNMSTESILCLVVPNDFSIIQEIYTNLNPDVPKWWIDPPFHLNYFTNESLTKLLVTSGFEVLHKTTMFPIDLFLLMGDHYVGNDETGKAAHDRRKRLEFAFFESGEVRLMNKLYESMAKLGIGRELVFYAKLRS